MASLLPIVLLLVLAFSSFSPLVNLGNQDPNLYERTSSNGECPAEELSASGECQRDRVHTSDGGDRALKSVKDVKKWFTKNVLRTSVAVFLAGVVAFVVGITFSVKAINEKAAIILVPIGPLVARSAAIVDYIEQFMTGGVGEGHNQGDPEKGTHEGEGEVVRRRLFFAFAISIFCVGWTMCIIGIAFHFKGKYPKWALVLVPLGALLASSYGMIDMIERRTRKATDKRNSSEGDIQRGDASEDNIQEVPPGKSTGNG